MGNTAFYGIMSGGGTYLANKFLISKLGTDAAGNDTPNGMWLRNIVRLFSGAVATFFWPGSIGAAVNGAMMYPLSSEFDQWWMRQGPATPAGPTHADLSDIEAELDDVLDGMDY